MTLCKRLCAKHRTLDHSTAKHISLVSGKPHKKAKTSAQAGMPIFWIAGIPKNLLIRFEDDQIDETTELASTLTAGSAVSTELDLTIKVLPGTPLHPLPSPSQRPAASLPEGQHPFRSSS